MDMPLCIDSHSKSLYSYRYEALCKTEDGVKEGKTAKLVGVGDDIADDYDGCRSCVGSKGVGHEVLVHDGAGVVGFFSK